jgi:hypothetical protein
MSGLLRFILGDRALVFNCIVGRESPRRATYFSLLRQRKVGKRKATRSLGPFASLRANLRWRVAAGGWLNSLRSNNASPYPAATHHRRPSQDGWGTKDHTGHRCARLWTCPLSRVRERFRVRAGETSPSAKIDPHPNPLPHAGEGVKLASRGGSQRSDASRYPSPAFPPLAAPRSGRFGGSGLALFERSEFSQTPPNLSTAGCPKRSAGSQTVGAISFSLVFLVRTRKSDSPPGDSRPAASKNKPLPSASNQS